MMNEAIAAIQPAGGISGGGFSGQIELGYGGSLSDISAFSQSLAKAEGTQANAIAAPSIEEPSATAKAAFQPLEFINSEAASLHELASSLSVKGGDLTPSEMMQLTTKSQEFMFHCQLTSNIANRTSDGLQQLFRQQG